MSSKFTHVPEELLDPIVQRLKWGGALLRSGKDQRKDSLVKKTQLKWTHSCLDLQHRSLQISCAEIFALFLLASVGMRRHRIGAVGVVAHEQQRHLQVIGQGIGEAITGVQAAGMVAPAKLSEPSSDRLRQLPVPAHRGDRLAARFSQFTAITALGSTARSMPRLVASGAECVIAIAEDRVGPALLQKRQLPHLLLQPASGCFGVWAWR